MKYLQLISILVSLFCLWRFAHLASLDKILKRAKNWETVLVDDYHVHVIPRNDTMVHEYTDYCSCGVLIEPVKRKDGSIGWLSTHRAQDGREN